MKINDSQPVNEPDVNDVNNDDVDVPDGVDTDEPSAFSKVLAKKRDGDQDADEKTSAKRSEKKDVDTPPPGLTQAQPAFDQPAQVTQVEGKRMVAVPPELQSLVREISVVVDAAGTQQVHIELNSNVMKGLQIQIERKDGAVAIQFQSSSEDVTRLLLKNTEALSQGLADRGISVADIRVTTPGEAARVPSYKSRSTTPGYSQSRGQGGRR